MPRVDKRGAAESVFQVGEWRKKRVRRGNGADKGDTREASLIAQAPDQRCDAPGAF